MPRPTNPAPPLRQQIYLRLRQAIEQGTFAPGDRLPPSREQARVLGVGRNTVLWAVERLQAEGYVQARVGDGSYVAQRPVPTMPGDPARALPPRPLSRRGRLVADTAVRWRPPTAAPTAFRVGHPAVDAFPFALWERLTRRTSAAMRLQTTCYLDPAGHPPLREAVAQWLLVSRGIRCEAAQVLITSGSQQAIDLIGRLLLDVGDEVLVEDPGYPGIRANLVGQGACVRPVPIDAEGMDIAQAAAGWPAARLAVVTPTHQFPLGVRMSLARRHALLDWARARQAWVVEDDYDGEFQYGEHRTPALCSMAHEGCVLHVGTFSKTLHPGLRLGFIVLPPGLVDAFSCAKALCDRHCPGETQDVLARFIADGHLLRHLRRMRELYLERQGLLIDALVRASGGELRLAPSLQGMHLVLEASPGAGDVALAARVAQAGAFLAPLSAYTLEAPCRGWMFGYAGYPPAEIARAAGLVAAAWRSQVRPA